MLGQAMAAELHDVIIKLDGNKTKYMIIGSVAAVIHGAKMEEDPQDVDIAVWSFKGAKEALNLGGVGQLKFTQNGVDFQIIDNTNREFGLDQQYAVEVAATPHNFSVWVPNLYQTLLSIVICPRFRKKDAQAFVSLMDLAADHLAEKEKAALESLCKSKSVTN